MRRVSCSACQTTLELSAAFALGSRVLCKACATREAASAHPHDGSAPTIVALVDPTICGRCGTDWGSRELPLLAGTPMCASCTESVRHRPFPAWLPASLVSLALLAMLSLWYHQRFLAAYLDLVRARQALARSDVAAAAREYGSAARYVPEDQGLGGMAAFFQGLALLEADKSKEAVPLLARAQRTFPQDRTIGQLARQAEAGAAFDAHDYALFLEKERALVALNPKEPMALAGVASALACQYAVSGSQELKTQALAELQQASALVKGDRAPFVEYEARILHRLETREIITRDEYKRRFPNGRSR